ncbi:MAG TPA: hypothetical protein VM580_19005, partial [Labilithrix sp.]|nr:hypothetical protein [Labilithrix sp.]
MSSWEDELREYFPGYLLPASAVGSLPREAAQLFLARLGGKADALTLLLAVSALAPVADEARAFATEIEHVARHLPSRTEVERVESEGVVRGRPDLPATLRRRLAGQPSRVVSTVPVRRFDLPENILLVGTAERLAGILKRLADSGLAAKEPSRGWAAGFGDCAEKISHQLNSTSLRHVSRVPIESFHEQAGRESRSSAYRLAYRLHEAMKSMDATDPAHIARVVAQGALAPLEDSTRFEIAVLIRLGRRIEQGLVGKKYTVQHALIDKDRDHVFEFRSGERSLRVYYNQGCFDPGPRDRGMCHYFNETGRLRPDITIELLENGKRTRAVIVEMKLSDKKGYLKEGYEQALLYWSEYAPYLSGRPKVILVVSSGDAIRGK